MRALDGPTNGTLRDNSKTDNADASNPGVDSTEASADAHKYWVSPIDPTKSEDVVVIHVCDETRQISKDFCCKRDILVKHMKYFEKFLQENESGYDDIDISVHCDVDIFEWLMSYIHKPDKTARAGQVRRGKHPDIFRVSSDGCISRALFGSHCQQLERDD